MTGYQRSRGLATFITAGSGPIPRQLIFNEIVAIEIIETEDSILQLPDIADATLLKRPPNPEGYTSLARNGLFVCDWTDVHKIAGQRCRAYELMAKPTGRRIRSNLDGPLAKLADSVVISVPDFGLEKSFRVEES